MYDIELLIQAELKAMQAKLSNYAGASDNRRVQASLKNASSEISKAIEELTIIRFQNKNRRSDVETLQEDLEFYHDGLQQQIDRMKLSIAENDD